MLLLCEMPGRSRPSSARRQSSPTLQAGRLEDACKAFAGAGDHGHAGVGAWHGAAWGVRQVACGAALLRHGAAEPCEGPAHRTPFGAKGLRGLHGPAPGRRERLPLRHRLLGSFEPTASELPGLGRLGGGEGAHGPDGGG